MSLVIICHAMFNTPAYLGKPAGKSLLDALATAGLRAAVFSPTGYGAGKTCPMSFEGMVESFDSFVEKQLRSGEEATFLGHSVGSVVYLSSKAYQESRLARSILVCPAVWGLTKPAFSAPALKQKVQLSAAYGISLLMGHLPSKLFGLGTVNHAPEYFQTFLKWNFRGEVAFDETFSGLGNSSQWQRHKGRILLLSAARDHWMAPHQNIAWIRSKLPANTLSLHAEEKLGYGYDADHFSVLYGKDAPVHTWPKLIRFLERGDLK